MMENWETISTFTYPQDAHIAQGFLESEGVESILKDELTVQVQNFYSNAIGGVKLQVKPKDIEKATSILKNGGYTGIESWKATETVVVMESTNKKQCPFCQSDNIGKSKKVDYLTIGVYLVLGTFFPIFRLNYSCFDCGKVWKYK